MGSPKESKKDRTWICMGLFTLCGLLSVIGGVLVLLFFRGFVDGMIKAEIPLRAGSKVTNAWMHPPVKPLLRIYLVHTTNPAGFLEGEKPSRVEMGPYTWEETWEKVGVSWSDQESVKYSIKKTYRFRRDLSIGGVEDRITLPNVPLFASVNQMRWSGKLVQQALSSMLGILKQKVFNSTTVGDIVWGFDHPLIKLGNDVLPPEQKLPFDKFGFFVNKNNSLEGVFEAKTGSEDIKEVGKVISFQGKTKLDFWSSEECNEIRGTDGSLFHPDVKKEDVLNIFNMNLCQSLPLVFQEEVVHKDINTYRFVPPSNVFGTPEENSKNQCYCDGDHCAPSGLFNVSKCQFGSPVMLSWPHFYQADPLLVEAVEGLNPNQEKHQFHIDIVPVMGVGMRAAVRSQINLVMAEMEHVAALKGVRDIIYPIMWFQDGLDELSDAETVSLLHYAVYTPETMRSIMYPTMFVVGALCLLAVAALLLKKHLVPENAGEVEPSGIPLPAKRYAANGSKPGSRTPPPDYDDTI